MSFKSFLTILLDFQLLYWLPSRKKPCQTHMLTINLDIKNPAIIRSTNKAGLYLSQAKEKMQPNRLSLAV